MSVILAFDFGATRIGVAMANNMLKISHPLMTVVGKNKYEKMDKIREIVQEWKPSLIIIGCPSIAVGNTQKELLLTQINRFAGRLHYSFPEIAIALVNEDYTSAQGVDMLNEQNIRGIAQKDFLDQVAAVNI